VCQEGPKIGCQRMVYERIGIQEESILEDGRQGGEGWIRRGKIEISGG
jgi:hypothetical protein